MCACPISRVPPCCRPSGSIRRPPTAGGADDRGPEQPAGPVGNGPGGGRFSAKTVHGGGPPAMRRRAPASGRSASTRRDAYARRMRRTLQSTLPHEFSLPWPASSAWPNSCGPTTATSHAKKRRPCWAISSVPPPLHRSLSNYLDDPRTPVRKTGRAGPARPCRPRRWRRLSPRRLGPRRTP